MGSKLFILLTIIFGVIAIAQMIRVNELSKKRSEFEPGEVPQRENNFNAWLWLIFGASLFGSTIYLLVFYHTVGLGPAATVHGQKLQFLFNVNWVIVFIVFFSCEALLFWFAFRWRRRIGERGYFFPRSDKLEILWTMIPSAALTVMVIMGLHLWNEITSPATAEYEDVELFSYQFAWTARYSGIDNQLGKYDYKLTTVENPYGIMTRDNIEKSLQLMKVGEPGAEGVQMLEEKLNDPNNVMSKKDRKKIEKELAKKERLLRLLDAMSVTFNDSLDDLANNDIILEDSLYLLKGQKYNFIFRSKDVIHSAYFPHFRAQMNTVPGMLTYFKMQPIYSTKEIREKMNNPDFDYALLCNKVCGTSHYKMKMTIKVLEPEEFLAWQKTKTTYGGQPWIQGNEQQILEYYQTLAARVDGK